MRWVNSKEGTKMKETLTKTKGNRHKEITIFNMVRVLAEVQQVWLRKNKMLTSAYEERESGAAVALCTWWECQWKNAYVKVIVFEVGLLELLVDSKGISHEGCRSSRPLCWESSWWSRTEAIGHRPLQTGSALPHKLANLTTKALLLVFVCTQKFATSSALTG